MPFEFLLIPGGAFLSALAVGVAGFGDALIAAALWLLVLSPAEAVPLVVSTGLVIHMIPLVRLRRALEFTRLGPFLIGGTLGVPAGSWLLGAADPEIFRTSVGAFLVVYGLIFLTRRPRGGLAWGGRGLDGAVGVLGGVMGGLAGLSGIVAIVWAGLRGWPKAEQRGLVQPFILAMHGMALGWLAAGGLVDAKTGWNFLLCLPAIALGSWLGLRLYGRLDERQFQRIVIVLLLVLGAMLLI